MLALILAPFFFLPTGQTKAEGRNPRSLAVIRQAPKFALATQSDKALRLSSLRGKVLLVSFIFTTCNGSCPATTHRMSEVLEELKKKDLAKKDIVRFLSITLDPARDTPSALA